MDHRTICGARPDSALRISYSDKSSTSVRWPAGGYLWLTFFTHPANKGQEIMSHYNDRAFVSRILIPAIAADWKLGQPDLSERFSGGLARFETGDVSGLHLIEGALGELPESISSGQIRQQYPEAYGEGIRAFPALLADIQRKFSIRSRALHHIGEVKRVALATEILNSSQGREGEERAGADAMKAVGVLLSESHASLRDLYEVSTDEVEEVIAIVEGSGLACGARLMGGGFGGNVLALAREADSGRLIDLVQQEYYGPRSRNGLDEGSVMVSTPGMGASEIA